MLSIALFIGIYRPHSGQAESRRDMFNFIGEFKIKPWPILVGFCVGMFIVGIGRCVTESEDPAPPPPQQCENTYTTPPAQAEIRKAGIPSTEFSIVYIDQIGRCFVYGESLSQGVVTATSLEEVECASSGEQGLQSWSRHAVGATTPTDPRYPRIETNITFVP